MKTYHEETLDDLWHKTVQDSLVFVHKDNVDMISGLSAKEFDVVLATDSMYFDLDLGTDLWLTKQRFTKLKKDYLPRNGEVEKFIARAVQIAKKDSKRGVVTQMHTRQHGVKGPTKGPKGSETPGNYQWGNCMLGFSFRGGWKDLQPTISLHSRASSLSDVGALDLALSYVLAREIGAQIDVEPENFAFRMFADSIQWQGLKGLAYIFTQDLVEDVDDEETYPSKEYPELRNIRRCLLKLREGEKAGMQPHEELFGPWKRMRERYYKWRNDEVVRPPVGLDELDLGVKLTKRDLAKMKEENE